jgi:hypothetical protein
MTCSWLDVGPEGIGTPDRAWLSDVAGRQEVQKVKALRERWAVADPSRHCERSEAIQRSATKAGLLRLLRLLAMTMEREFLPPALIIWVKTKRGARAR